MYDKVEIEYWIAELDNRIREVEEMDGIARWDREIKSLKAQKKQIERELKEIKDKLATALTNRAMFTDAIQKYQDSKKDLEAQLPKVLIEHEAVDVLKKVREKGGFNAETNQYTAGSYPDAERFWKAVYTLGGTVNTRIEHNDGEYIVTVPKFDNPYREFLCGETVTD